MTSGHATPSKLVAVTSLFVLMGSFGGTTHALAQLNGTLVIQIRDSITARTDKIGKVRLGHDNTGWYLTIEGVSVGPVSLGSQQFGRGPLNGCIITSADRAAILDLHHSVMAALLGEPEIGCYNAERSRAGFAKVSLDDRRATDPARFEVVLK